MTWRDFTSFMAGIGFAFAYLALLYFAGTP